MVYVIAQLSITDRTAYRRYQDRFMAVMAGHAGRVLAADERPLVVEGVWDRDKIVLISFPDHAAFHAWAESPEYQEIARDRKAGASAVVVVANGIGSRDPQPC